MILHRLASLRRDIRGAAVIEMAMVAPVFALGVIGIVDVSNAYSKKLGLEQGAQRAVEKIMNTTETNSVEATLSNEVQCQVNGVNADGTCKTSNTQTITVNWRLDCTDAGGAVSSQTTTSSLAYDAFVCGGGTTSQARYVSVTVTDKYSPLFPIHFGGYNTSDSTYHLSASAGVRTS